MTVWFRPWGPDTPGLPCCMTSATPLKVPVMGSTESKKPAADEVLEAFTGSLPTAHHDLPASSFPFNVEFFRADTREVVHTIEVEGPGAVKIPALGKEFGPVGVRINHASGRVEEFTP